MTLNLNKPEMGQELKPRIVVVGVGGAGCNAVNNMIDLNLEGVEFVVTNSDAQSLAQSRAERKIQLGTNITHGLGAGARPDIGRAAAEEALDDVISQLQGSHMAFVTAGMGGGTGTGAAPVIARAAREMGILTVGVVTKPFHFEGSTRMDKADDGLHELQQYVDTLIVIPNQNLFRICNEKTTFADAFRLADNVLYSGVRGVTDLMVMPGLINLDFADIRTVMSEMGKAMMGTGEASGDKRAIDAAEAAIANPLLDDVSMKGAKGVLINITGGADMTLFEVDEAANRIRDEVDPHANIIFGSTFDENLDEIMRVSIVATGIDVETVAAPRPATVSILTPAERRQPEIPTQSARPQPAAEPLRAAVGHDTAATAIAGQQSSAIGGIAAPAPKIDSHIPPIQATAPAAPIATAPVAQPTPAAPQPAPAQMRTAPADNPFIAPRAVEPAMGGLTPERAGDPFTTRVVRPSSAEPRRRKALGILQRVTDRVAGIPADEPEAEATSPQNTSAEATTDLLADNDATPVVETPPQAEAESGATAANPATDDTAATDGAAPQEAPQIDVDPDPTLALPDAPSDDADSPQQPSLGYVENQSGSAGTASEEDLLEIPAFLRRQAN